MMRRVTKAIMASMLLLLAGAARAAEPAASDWSTNEGGRLRLISAAAAVGEDDTLRLGLDFDLKPGWKIYWRSPGDAGYPPKVDWSASRNLSPPDIRWPAPHRFTLAGLQNHGYKGHVVLPVAASVAHPGQPVSIRAKVDYLACAELCVPMQSDLALDLPAGSAPPSPFVHDLGRFDALVPGDAARAGMRLASVEAVGDKTLRVTVTADQPMAAPDLFVEPPEVASFGEPRVTLSDGGRRAVIEEDVAEGTLQRPLAAGPLTLTVTAGERAFEASATPAPASALPLPAPGALAGMLAAALLGGLILNLMPCVLPVLSIKVAGALGHGGGERHHIRAAFLASAAGILVSFLALAGAAAGLKAAGAAVGWGIQFQQPAFLVVMIAILLLFAANLWGLYEIRLPGLLSSAGGKGKGHHTLFGHFLSGAFATLLATPCSAPFLGTAVGFALARGPAEIMAIFATLGVGMSTPYLAVAVWPGAAQRLPRPGPWMRRLRQILGLALVGTAVWLGSVLAAQTGLLRQERPADSSVAWSRFDETAIPGLIANGKVVFVDVTADWCITCKVNKATVVEREPVAGRLRGGGVVAMEADWTRPDEGISRYLASFGRYGIPFNVVYGPGAPQGIPLSELLTQDEVLAALDSASKAP